MAPTSGYFSDWQGADTSNPEQRNLFTWNEYTDCVSLFGYDVPDGAIYAAPEGIDNVYITNAVDYLRSLAPSQREGAFFNMYTNQSHPHFLDFKEFYPSASGYAYDSQAAGGPVNSTPFEAFGNFIYGFVGTMGGIDPGVLRVAAAVMQEGEAGPGFRDHPQDKPHVELGIQMAVSYMLDDRHMLSIDSCGD